MDILIRDRFRALEMLRQNRNLGLLTALVSIEDPDRASRPPIEGFDSLPKKIRLNFHDVRERHLAMLTADGDVDQFILPSRDHVQALVDFAKKLSKKDTVLFHCEAGISRSTAAALICYRVVYGPRSLRKAAKLVVESSPYARPNDLMCKFADEIIGGEELYRLARKISQP